MIFAQKKNLLLKVVISGSLCLSGCMSNNSLLSLDNQDNIQNLSISRQKQRISLLQKKLQNAQKDLCDAQELVSVLSKELQASRLALIARQIENYEQQVEKAQSFAQKNNLIKFSQDQNLLFIKERELLEEMMENGPSPESSQAQIVLDKVLRLITESQDIETRAF